MRATFIRAAEALQNPRMPHLCRHRIKREGDRVEVIAEQARVYLERHRSRLVTEHLLHGLDIGPGRDRERSGGVPEVVETEHPHVAEASPLARWREHAATPGLREPDLPVPVRCAGTMPPA